MPIINTLGYVQLERATMSDNDRLVSVAEAATLLGISTDAVRKRLVRGTLSGRKESGQWRVVVNDTTDSAPGPDNGALRSGHMSDELIAELRDTNADLRMRLDTADRRTDVLITDLRQERERADTLQALNIQQRDRIRELEALTANVQDDIDQQDATESTENGDIGTGHTDSRVPVDNPPPSGWSRFVAWLRGE